MPQLYTLRDHGDSIEQRHCSGFLASEFPAFEIYWQKSIVPLTNRPHNIHNKTDSELAAIGKKPEDFCNSQLHYTVLVHLDHCLEIKKDAMNHLGLFTDFMVRLSSALDPADELLQRTVTPGMYDPWSEDDGRKARRKWREVPAIQTERVKLVKDYRNKLLHGRISPHLVVQDPATKQRSTWPVKLDKQDGYVDWRVVTGVIDAQPLDFAPAPQIMEEAWSIVLEYLDRQWKDVLL